jgi:hypothetical protein
MNTFTLDTSGSVALPDNGQTAPAYWSDLDADAQRLVARTLRDLFDAGQRRENGSALGFSDLSPDTLVGLIGEAA